MPRTKVVILNWNGEHHLRQFLPSVVEYTPAGVAVVVADNGSTDGSLALLAEQFPAVEIVRLDHNYGFAEGYNRALEQVASDYFILLNSDVEVTPGWCEPLIAAAERDPMLAAVSPKMISFNDKSRFEYAGAAGGFIDRMGYPFCRGRILSTLEKDCGQYDTPRDVFWASGACMLVRADIFRRLGGFDGGFFAHMEEIDLCWRAQLLGYRIAVEPSARVYHLGGGTLPNNNPRKIYLNYRNNLAMLYKNLTSGRLYPVLFVRMVLDGCSAMVFLLQGRVDFFTAVFRAHIDFYRRVGELRVLRRQIQGEAVTRSQNIYKGFVLLRYMFGRKRFDNMM